MLRRLPRLAIYGLGVVLGGLTGCVTPHPVADDYFSGAYLEAAQAIVANDMAQLQEAAKRLDDIDAPGEKGMTLLWFAMSNERFEAVRTLIELGSDPTGQVAKGLGTPILVALQHKDTRHLEAILEGGFDPNWQSEGGTPLIHEAAGPAGHTLEHTKLLLDYGADVNARDSLRSTPLLEAISTHKPAVAEYLVEQGADVNAYTINGVSMMWAVHSIIERQSPGTPLRRDFERLRDLMIEKGAKYPPDPPEQVRAWARAQGLEMIGD